MLKSAGWFCCWIKTCQRFLSKLSVPVIQIGRMVLLLDQNMPMILFNLRVEFMYLLFTCVPCESYRRRLRSLLYFCYVFRALINSLVWRLNLRDFMFWFVRYNVIQGNFVFNIRSSLYRIWIERQGVYVRACVS